MMKQQRIRNSKSEEGIALLISIFVLLLISVVAIALIVSSGTESALAGNYRSSTGVYNAAIAGLEEVRARLRPQSPISFKNTDAAFLPAGGAPLAACSPIYVINPLGGEPVTPWVPGSTYADAEFNQEFAGICALPNPSRSTMSIWNGPPLNGLPFPGPLYKWVRINAVSEQSLQLDVAPYDGTRDPTSVYYDGANLNDGNSGSQVLEITSLAVLPNGSQKLVQYLTAPLPLNLNFNAALTLDGENMQPNAQFTVPNSSNFSVRGNDQYSAGSCNPGPGTVDAVGYTDPSDSTITSAIQSGMPAAMSASNPMTIVINGDLTFNGWHNTGYGLLLVTGTFTFDPDATWNGIVMVIGKGKLYSHQGGTGQLNGAVFLASTNPAVPPFFDFTSSSGSNGIYYSMCWIQASLPTMPYKILSFHEISQ